jgi:transposase-like protein
MTNLPITWSEIEAEAQGFRQGLVALFRKYEGQPTDEKDGNGRTVRVTAAAFARHLGIEDSTFRRWVKAQDRHAGDGGRSAISRTQSQLTHDVRRAARQAPQAIVEAVSELPAETQHEIVRELHRKQLERAGADFSESGRKGRQARTAEHFEPLHQSLNVMQIVPLAEKLAEKLRDLPSDLTEEDRREIDSAIDDVFLARTEMHMRAEVND